MSKKRIFIIGSCVSRDIFDLTDRYEIAACVGRTSLASAFGDKYFFGPTDKQLASHLESNWQRRCIRNDTHKQLKFLLREKEYDVLFIDFVDERFKLMEYDGAYATLSREFLKTGLHKTAGIKKMRPYNFKRMHLWKKGLDTLFSIANEKKVPIILNKVYPAIFENEHKLFNIWSNIREYYRLYWFYKQVPENIKIICPFRKNLIGDIDHRWGRSQFHYIPQFYECLLQQFDKALEDTRNSPESNYCHAESDLEDLRLIT